MKLDSTLRRKTVLKVSKALKAQGRKLPKRGWCSKIADGEVCHDAHGYYWARKPQSQSFDGLRKSKRRGSRKFCKKVKRGKASFTVCK